MRQYPFFKFVRCKDAEGVLIVKGIVRCFMYAAVFTFTLSSFAADHYVTPPGGYGTNNFPYTTWAEAATQIQWAVGAATNGETVWVTNGNYVLTNQIVITNGVILKSVNGWTNTVVDGNYPNTTNRCIYALGSGVRRPVIDGFTITNGYAQSNDFSGEGGGVNVSYGDVFNCLIAGNQTATLTTNTAWHRGGGGGMFLGGSACTVLTCIVRGNASRLGGGILSLSVGNYISNCVISTNHSFTDGGALADRGILVSSLISNNWADTVGGGVYMNGVYITNCVLVGNRSIGSAGGAVWFIYAGTIDGCVISNNYGGYLGGGLYFGPDDNLLRVVKNSIIVNNSTPGGGGGIYAYSGIIRQCLIKNNRQNGATYGGAGICLKNFKNNTGYVASVDSCTIVSNTGAGQGGGIAIEGTNSNYSVSNCVVWGNIATNVGGNDLTDLGGPTNFQAFSWTCANYTNFAAGQHNITNDPRFLDFAGGNYRLAPESPCVNTGSNQNWMTNSVDLDGRRRILYGTVDMGAYEHIDEGTIYNIR